MECLIYRKVKNIFIDDKEIEQAIESILKKNRKNACLSIQLVGDKKIKKLNSCYRGRDEVTDVLSFSAQEGENLFENDELGDIFISIPQIKRQAKSLSIDYRQEFFRILIHGILHLLGFDHKKDKQAKEMFFLQEKYLRKIL